MILGDVEETVTTIEIDEETYEEIYKVRIENLLNFIVLLVYCWLLFEPRSSGSFGTTMMKVERISKDLVLVVLISSSCFNVVCLNLCLFGVVSGVLLCLKLIVRLAGVL